MQVTEAKVITSEDIPAGALSCDVSRSAAKPSICRLFGSLFGRLAGTLRTRGASSQQNLQQTSLHYTISG
jgi:hypothetical protein